MNSSSFCPMQPSERCEIPVSPCPQEQTKAVILLVEDEAVVREVTRAVLEGAGYRVLECTGPEQALRVAREYRGGISVLISDVVMPEMNGVELAQQLTELQPGLVTVLMSGYPSREVLQSALLENAAYLQKPFTIDGLLSCIATALRREPVGAGT